LRDDLSGSNGSLARVGKKCKVPDCQNRAKSRKGQYCESCRPSGASPASSSQAPSGTTVPLKRSSEALSPHDVQSKKSRKPSDLLTSLNLLELAVKPVDDIVRILEDVRAAEVELLEFYNDSRVEIGSLEESLEMERAQRVALEADCVLLKVAVADKELELIRLKSLGPRSGPEPHVSQAVVSESAPLDYASVAKKVPVDQQISSRQQKATLVARFPPGTDLSTVNRKFFDGFFDLRKGGPPVQSFRRTEDAFYLDFPSLEQRNRAQELASEKAAPFEKVFVPEKQFPLIVKFTGLSGVAFPSPSEVISARAKKEEEIIRKLDVENQNFKGQFTSLRVLNHIRCADAGTDSYLVRLCLRTAIARDEALRNCTLSLDGEYHRVDRVNLNREVRRCTRCQSYRHGTRGCRAASFRCAFCACDHPTKDCRAPEGSVPLCCNCGVSGHRAGDFSCRAHLAAVAALRDASVNV